MKIDGFFSTHPSRDAAFLYIGLAVRMAVSLGMHQEATNSVMDEVELEHRRRVWWSTYSMDRYVNRDTT